MVLSVVVQFVMQRLSITFVLCFLLRKTFFCNCAVGCALFGLRSPVIVLSELKRKLPFLSNLELGKTWIWAWQSCRWAPVQLLASSTILAKYPDSDPRLPMLQIAKGRYCRVQLTELYKMRPEPKKGRTLVRGHCESTVWWIDYKNHWGAINTLKVKIKWVNQEKIKSGTYHMWAPNSNPTSLLDCLSNTKHVCTSRRGCGSNCDILFLSTCICVYVSISNMLWHNIC